METAGKYNQTLKPGGVYRRDYFSDPSSGDTDYLLRKLCTEGVLKKLKPGLYYRPSMTEFGEKFPKEHLLLKNFLKSDDFLLFSPNDYNALGLGTTQLYNLQFVYNTKRDGMFEFLGRRYRFFRKFDFPSKITKEFLVVDMLNNRKLLAEDENQIKASLKSKIDTFDRDSLRTMANRYGKIATKKFINEALNVSS